MTARNGGTQMMSSGRSHAGDDSARVRFVRDREALRFGNQKPTEEAFRFIDEGLVRLAGDGTYFYGPYDVVEQASLSQLKAALVAACSFHALPSANEERGTSAFSDRVKVRLEWTLADRADFDEDIIVPEPGSIALTDDHELLVRVDIPVEGRDPFEPFPELQGVLASWASNRGADLVGLEGQLSNTFLWSCFFRFPIRGCRVRDIQAFALDAYEIGAAFGNGDASADLLVAILDSGQASALVGLPESSTFECKRELRLTDDRGRLTFAKDVAAFANSGAQGLLVVGPETKARPDGDFVVGLHPVPDAERSARMARRTIDRLVFPPIDGLQVKIARIGTTGDHVLYCHIPEQAPELKPFMVGGAFIEGKIDGSLISIPRRRDDETIHLSPASIHSFLAAGYALFRRSAERDG